MMNTLFVYGTLMKGFINHDAILSDYVIRQQPGFLTGDLYHLDYGYPAAVEGTGLIKGEIMYVKQIEDLLKSLDKLEDYNNHESDLYVRQIRNVLDGAEDVISCYVYMWSPKRLHELSLVGTKIENGDWRKFMKKKG